MYAVIETGGKQYRVQPGDIIDIERLPGTSEESPEVTFERVLMVSYGSGAGSDAMAWRTTEALAQRRDRAPRTQSYVARRQAIDYGTYVRFRKKLHTH